MVSMVTLPDQSLWEIMGRITNTADRNSVSLTCKRLYQVDNEQRLSLRVGCGLNPANEALNNLCIRFPNLKKVEIIYSGWTSESGKQLDDQGLLNLSNCCPSLSDLTLSYCTFITDMGVGYLASCSQLSTLKLNFATRITGAGILSVVVFCKNLTVLHLIRCLNISGAEWIEHLGKLETIEDLWIENCKAIGEGDLIKLGNGWRKLKHLHFEVDGTFRYLRLYDRLGVDRWQTHCIPCENMLELNLVNCVISPGRGLTCVLDKCKNLEKIKLDMCLGLRDTDIVALSQKSRGIRSVSLRVPSDFTLPNLLTNPLRLTDESLKALARNCSLLESLKISFSDGESPSLSSFTLEGIISLVRSCPIRELTLEHVYAFDDIGLEALCSASSLETLELVRCQEISDDGLIFTAQYPKLHTLRLNMCLGVTDDGLKPLMGHKLDQLAVEDCPLISAKGVQGVARSVSYKQDLTWMN